MLLFLFFSSSGPGSFLILGGRGSGIRFFPLFIFLFLFRFFLSFSALTSRSTSAFRFPLSSRSDSLSVFSWNEVQHCSSPFDIDYQIPSIQFDVFRQFVSLYHVFFVFVFNETVSSWLSILIFDDFYFFDVSKLFKFSLYFLFRCFEIEI